ncbi:MAG: formate dehydrogenase subunit gamma [Desulfomonilia bacterium]
MSDNTQTMVRVTDPIERISHWLLAGSCLFCLFTGLGLMFRSWDFIPALLGGLYALKWMHIFSGVAFAFALISAYLMWKKDCAFEPDDAKWIVQGGGYLWKTDKLPPVYKYNAGQKLFFWFVVIFGALIVLTGLVMWNPMAFPVAVARWSYALHALSALVIGSFFVVHLYLGTIGNPGTFQAMTTGLCTRAWCKTHCPRWLEDHYKKIEQEP